MSCDNTGLRPVLGARLCRVCEVQTRLFHWQASEPPPQGFLSYSMEEGQYEHVPEGCLYWSEGVPNVWGDPMHKLPLLLE